MAARPLPPPPSYSDCSPPACSSQQDLSPNSSTYVQLTPNTSTAALASSGLISPPRTNFKPRDNNMSSSCSSRMLADALRLSLARLNNNNNTNISDRWLGHDENIPEAEREPMLHVHTRANHPYVTSRSPAVHSTMNNRSLPDLPGCLRSTPPGHHCQRAWGDHSCNTRNSGDINKHHNDNPKVNLLAGMESMRHSASTDGRGSFKIGATRLERGRQPKIPLRISHSLMTGVGSLSVAGGRPFNRASLLQARRGGSCRQRRDVDLFSPNVSDPPCSSGNPTITITADSGHNSTFTDYLCCPEPGVGVGGKMGDTLFIGDDISLYGTPKEELSPLRVGLPYICVKFNNFILSCNLKLTTPSL
jgi:hypothetical protein